MSDTTTTTAGLTTNDIKAMRQADYCSFHLFQGVATIRCTKEVKNPGPFDAKQREHSVTVAATVRDYREEYSYSQQDRYQCFAMSYGYSDIWRTLADHVFKAGDLVNLFWIGGNDSQNLKTAGLTQDLLKIEIKRGDKKLVFNLDDCIVSPHSSAKMVRKV